MTRSRSAFAMATTLAVLGWTAAPAASTTFSNGAAISSGGMGAATLYPSPIQVTGMHGTIENVVVTLKGISTTGNEMIVLSGPNGQSMALAISAGATSATWTLSDRGPTHLVGGSNPTGMYQPAAFTCACTLPAPGPATFNLPPPPGVATLLSTFGGSDPNGTWNLWVAGFNAQAVTIASGWSIAFTTTAGQIVDFNGDGRSDYTTLRASGQAFFWYTLNTGGFSALQWGPSTSEWGFTGDYDADGKTDPVVCTTSLQCYARRSSDGGFEAPQWGTAGDVPLMPGDYDGDGKTDFVAWRAATGVWYVRRSSDGGLTAVAFGQAGDRPLVGDMDGDGLADLNVFRPATGTYYTLGSAAGFTAIGWGVSTDKTAPADYDGDGKIDPAVVRDTGPLTFYVRRSTDGALFGVQWGTHNDLPAPGDYDGDGKADIAVWRPSTATFYVRKSSDGALLAQAWGLGGDFPIANFVVR